MRQRASTGRATRIAALFALGALASGAWPPDAAAHVAYGRTTLRQWIANADAVVVVRFESDVEMWRAEDGSDRQETFRVQVLESLRGSVPTGALRFLPHAEGLPAWRAGDRALLFLERTATRREFASLAAPFPWLSLQGAGEEWTLTPADETRVLEVARRIAAHRSEPPRDAKRAVRELLLAQLASGVPRLRRDAIAELVTLRGWPALLDVTTTEQLAAFTRTHTLPPAERLALVGSLEGAEGFDATAALLALTRESLEEIPLAQLLRVAGRSRDPALRAWVAERVDDPRPRIRNEARAALAAAPTPAP